MSDLFPHPCPNCGAMMTVPAGCGRLEQEIERLKDECKQLNDLFDFQHVRIADADAEYVAANPRPECLHGYRPDLGELIRWLRSERDAARAEIERLKTAERRLRRCVNVLANRLAVYTGVPVPHHIRGAKSVLAEMDQLRLDYQVLRDEYQELRHSLRLARKQLAGCDAVRCDGCVVIQRLNRDLDAYRLADPDYYWGEDEDDEEGEGGGSDE